MIVILGGLVGVGKTSLARSVAHLLGAEYFDIDSLKPAIYSRYPDYNYYLHGHLPFPDELRLEVLSRALSDIKRLRVTQQHVIADETLHKMSFRTFVRESVQAMGDACCLVWIQASEQVVAERLRGKREGHMIPDAWRLYLEYKRVFEAMDDADIVFQNNAPLSESSKALAAVVKKRLGEW